MWQLYAILSALFAALTAIFAKVGVANVNLSKLKNGKVSAIRFSTLEAICDVLNCQPGDILEYKKLDYLIQKKIIYKKEVMNSTT